MKVLIYILCVLTFVSCVNGRNTENINSLTDSTKLVTFNDEEENNKLVQYSDIQLETFLDSIGKLSPSTLMEKVAFIPDSIFKNQLQINKSLSNDDFGKLKKAIKAEKIDIETAKSIFGQITVDSTNMEGDKIPITYYSFDNNKTAFNEFAVCLGNTDFDWSCELYFFKSNTLISKHSIYHRYGLELQHYKDTDGRTIIYYKENYESGTGIWWFNFYFYKYYDNKLIPVLNELENGNLQNGWGLRIWWLQAAVQKTNPLTIKMVYYQEFSDTLREMLRLIDDSTIVQYSWEEKSMSLIGDYENSKISKPQIMSYYLGDNELLFINAYYDVLKKSLLDQGKRHFTLSYLNEIKNRYRNN